MQPFEWIRLLKRARASAVRARRSSHFTKTAVVTRTQFSQLFVNACAVKRQNRVVQQERARHHLVNVLLQYRIIDAKLFKLEKQCQQIRLMQTEHRGLREASRLQLF